MNELNQSGRSRNGRNSPEEPSRPRQAGELVWKMGFSGFIQQGCFGIIPPELNREEQDPCLAPVHPCTQPDCREWLELIVLPGKTRREAMAAFLRGESSGLAHHVNECEMLDDRPGPARHGGPTGEPNGKT